MTKTITLNFEHVSRLPDEALKRVFWDPVWVQESKEGLRATFTVAPSPIPSSLIPGRFLLELRGGPGLQTDMEGLLIYRQQASTYNFAPLWTIEGERATALSLLHLLGDNAPVARRAPTSAIWGALQPYKSWFVHSSEVDRVWAMVIARAAFRFYRPRVKANVLRFLDMADLLDTEDMLKIGSVDLPDSTPEFIHILRKAAEIQNVGLAYAPLQAHVLYEDVMKAIGWNLHLAQSRDTLDDLFYLLTRSPADRRAVLESDLARRDTWATRHLWKEVGLGDTVWVDAWYEKTTGE